jgi:hypothetical protein
MWWDWGLSRGLVHPCKAPASLLTCHLWCDDSGIMTARAALACCITRHATGTSDFASAWACHVCVPQHRLCPATAACVGEHAAPNGRSNSDAPSAANGNPSLAVTELCAVVCVLQVRSVRAAGHSDKPSFSGCRSWWRGCRTDPPPLPVRAEQQPSSLAATACCARQL